MTVTSRIASRVLVVAIAAMALNPGRVVVAADAPPRAPAPHPRIGLALSGGGARGIAHVGVLKVLEEMRIPISCVTGTSMGAIVGATFAAGTPPDKMEKVVLAADWDEIFRDRPPKGHGNGNKHDHDNDHPGNKNGHDDDQPENKDGHDDDHPGKKNGHDNNGHNNHPGKNGDQGNNNQPSGNGKPKR